LATKEIENNDVVMYPNPTKDMLFFATAEQIDEVRIYDLSGKEREKYIPEQNRINLKNLERGVYLLRVKNDNKTIIKKAVKY
jgi:hypothetical protein